MKAKAQVVIGIIVLVVVLVVVTWLWQRSRSSVPAPEPVEEPAGLGAEILEKTQSAQEKVQEPVPETNPFKKANPFSDAYKNPFE